MFADVDHNFGALASGISLNGLAAIASVFVNSITCLASVGAFAFGYSPSRDHYPSVFSSLSRFSREVMISLSMPYDGTV